MTKARDLSKGVFDTLTVDGATAEFQGSGTNTTYFTGGDDSVSGRQLTLSSVSASGQNNATHRLTVPSGYGSFNIQVNSSDRLKINNNGDIHAGAEGGSGLNIDLRQGSLKSWIDLNGSSFGIDDSHNVSSATDNGAGNYHQNLSNNLSATRAGTAGSAASNINYSDREVSVLPESTSHLQINTGQDYTVNRADSTYVATVVAGDLA